MSHKHEIPFIGKNLLIITLGWISMYVCVNVCMYVGVCLETCLRCYSEMTIKKLWNVITFDL